jgi:3-oxoacyl-[acyl-carrier-protein] synthase-3
MDFAASHLQADLGANSAFVVGLSQQACTGMLGSLRGARGLLATDPALDNILCITADRFPEGAKYEQSYALISDGAACCMVSRSRGAWKLLGCHAITNGALAYAGDDEAVGSFFTWMHRAITETMQRCELAIGDIAWIVPQNMNVKAWQILARLLGISYERVAFPALADVGHVISGDNVINLMRLEGSGRVKRGDKVLLPMAGYGLNWQCAVLERT